MSVDIRIEGVDEFLQAIQRAHQALQDTHETNEALESGAKVGALAAASIVHKRSGALASAQIVMEMTNGVIIGIDPTVTSPKGQRPSVYGPIYAKRVEDFYAQVLSGRGAEIAARVISEIAQAMGIDR